MTTSQAAPAQNYDAGLLDKRLHAALPAPALRLIVTGPSGSGKSTVLAAVPIPEGKTRLALDFEDSMAYLDAGPEGKDLYLPRRQAFRMERVVFPTLTDVADAYMRLMQADTTIGALIVDNISLLQDQVADLLQSGNVKQIRALCNRFDVGHYLPVDSIVARWAQQRDPAFWQALKLIPKRLVLTCLRRQIHFIGSTEEGNLWRNYGKATAEVIGKKANALKTWTQFTDAVIFLERDANATAAPRGKINPLEPKMRIQGMNPTWTMDWPSFIAELEAARARDSQPIPEAAKVSTDVISEEPPEVQAAAEIAGAPEPVAPPVPALASNGNGHGEVESAGKIPDIKTRRWQAAIKAFADRHPKYQGARGKPNGFHIGGRVGKLGFTEVTDANLDEVMAALEQHAAEAESETAREVEDAK